MTFLFSPGIPAVRFMGLRPNFVEPQGQSTSGRRLLIPGSNAKPYINADKNIDRWSQIFEFHFYEHDKHLGLANLLLDTHGGAFSKWMPTWKDDMIPSLDIISGDNFMHVEPGFPIENKYALSSDMRDPPYTSNDEIKLTNRWGLMLLDADGDYHMKRIAYPNGIIPGPGSTLRINFEPGSEFSKSMTKESIQGISTLYRARINGKISLSYETDAVVVANVAFTEVFYEWSY